MRYQCGCKSTTLRKLTHVFPRLVAPIAAGVAGLVICAQIANGDTDITLRANRPLSAEATAALAGLGKPRTLDRGQYPDAKHFSGEEVSRILCGSFTKSYWDKTLEANPALRAMPSNKRLGDQVFAVHWPACPYVLTTQRPLTVRVGKGDTQASLYKRLTGAQGTSQDMLHFYLPTSGPFKAGKTVTISHVTLPTSMLIQDTDALDRVATSKLGSYFTIKDTISLGASPAPLQVRVPVAAGHLASGVGDQYKPPDECLHPSSNAAMVNPVAVTAAYQLALQAVENANLSQIKADVVVIDNGFFGARGGAPVFGPPFPPEFFYTHFSYPDGLIGPLVMAMGTPIYPIIDPSRFPTIDETSGHGTHTAGLVFGGTAFQDPKYRSVFYLGSHKAWLRVIVANIADGGPDLVAGSEWGINAVVSFLHDKIVNLSLTYVDDGNQQFGAVLQNALELGNTHNDLFIVAAGNESKDDLQTERIQPAGLGGLSTDNVVTVAAHRQNGDLSQFTNRGPNTVDIAAPGCQLSSWLDSSGTPTAVSGTSQAAAVTTFAAALLKSLGNPSALWIKRRLIISGRLLEDSNPPQKTLDGLHNVLAADIASRSRLDIPVALQSMDAYMRYQLPGEASETQALGSIEQMDDVTCKGAAARRWDDIWAIKRSTGDRKAWLFSGKTTGKPQHIALNMPCEVEEAGNPTIYFKPRLMVESDWSTSAPKQTRVPIPLSSLKMYVAQTVPQ